MLDDSSCVDQGRRVVGKVSLFGRILCVIVQWALADAFRDPTQDAASTPFYSKFVFQSLCRLR